MFKFNKTHLDKFVASKPSELDRNIPGGKKAMTIAALMPEAEAEHLEDRLYSHDDVVGVVKSDSQMPTKCVAILAWGGIRKDNFKALIGQKNQDWLNICENIFNGSLSRKQAFNSFQDLRNIGNLKGMGCAYYTKLIYFLQFSSKIQEPNSYIMDQWASESINLLIKSDEPIVKVDTTRSTKWAKKSNPQIIQIVNSTVSDLNTPEDYEHFCLAMDQLRRHEKLNLSRPQVDRAVMGNNEEDENSWRKYVVTQRSLREGIALNGSEN